MQGARYAGNGGEAIFTGGPVFSPRRAIGGPGKEEAQEVVRIGLFSIPVAAFEVEHRAGEGGEPETCLDDLAHEFLRTGEGLLEALALAHWSQISSVMR